MKLTIKLIQAIIVRPCVRQRVVRPGPVGPVGPVGVAGHMQVRRQDG